MRLSSDRVTLHSREVKEAAEQIREWMKSVVDGGLPVIEWASRSGVAKSTIFRALKPDYEFTTSSKTLEKLARAAGVAPPRFLGEAADPRIIPRVGLPIRYRVQAGLWHEVDNHSHFEMRDDERRQYQDYGAVVPHGRYADWPQWLEIVSGDSINRKAPEGSLAHVVDAIEMGYAPADGDWVVVERRRDQGGLRERTIKQVEIREGKVLLMPRSTNAKWSEPVNYLNGSAKPGEDIEVEIVGKVIGFYLTA